ncbi:unnamed protein product [Nezara viridula]|uniref:Lactate/malate dehydrogenase C-terminal domain-containing protein n=1 Tax=Nezara viridula TaxID=85310 RepID=A0A9P0MTE4_NEZVI|nr:unnamed protein product [Nezara viridula]
MAQKTVIKELKRLRKEENPFFKDKETQMVDYQNKAVTIVGGSEDNEFLMGLLYELYSGQLYGDRSLVRVYLFDSKDNLEKAEFAYVSIWISGLPFFDDFILTSDPKRALKKSEYVIIHPNIKWDKELTREQIIIDNFPFFKTLAEQICEHCIPSVQILLIGIRCMVPFRLILALFLNKLPLSQVHAITRTVERAAASLISHKVECNSNEIQGVAVFGEDIVEVYNAWMQWSPACDADLIDLTTIKYGDPELGQWVEKREELREAMARLELPKGVEVIGVDPLNPNLDDKIDLPPLVVPKANAKSHLTAADFEGEQFLPCKEEGGFEEIEVEVKSHQTEEQRSTTTEETEDRMYNVVTPEQSKCRNSLTGYAQAKGVINYIRKVLLAKKSVYTNEVVCSPGIYGIPEGLYSSFPVRIDANGSCKIIQGYYLSEMTLFRIRRMVKEVLDDYDLVFELFYYNPPQEAKDLWIMKDKHEQLPEEPMEVISEYQDELKAEEAEEE